MDAVVLRALGFLHFLNWVKTAPLASALLK
jgi:hypothetical protein